jgi:hypothetical protein
MSGALPTGGAKIDRVGARMEHLVIRTVDGADQRSRVARASRAVDSERRAMRKTHRQNHAHRKHVALPDAMQTTKVSHDVHGVLLDRVGEPYALVTPHRQCEFPLRPDSKLQTRVGVATSLAAAKRKRNSAPRQSTRRASTGHDSGGRRTLSRLVSADFGAEADRYPIPAIDRDDGEREIREFLFGKFRARLRVHVVRCVRLRD